VDNRQREWRRKQSGTPFLYPFAIDFHGTFRETGRYPDTCNDRPYRAYTGTFYAHPGSQRLHICSYYRPAVKETSQKQGAKHK